MLGNENIADSAELESPTKMCPGNFLDTHKFASKFCTFFGTSTDFYLFQISKILALLQEPSEDQQRLMLINDLIEKLALSEKWHARQT
mgnify:CR=1 FL=1